MKQPMTKLSVVTTIYRSADCIEEFHRLAVEAAASIGAELEMIFVNDGSPDNGWQVVAELAGRDTRVVAVDLARNVGQHRALLVGLELTTGDLVAIFDGDLEEDPRWVADFHRTLGAQGCDVVYGIQQGSQRGVFYRLGRKLFYKLVNLLSSLSLPENVATARLMTRRYVDAVLRFEEREVFLAGILHVTGFRQVAVPVSKRAKSPTTYSVSRLAALFINNITSFSVRPLIGMFILGGLLLVLSGVVIAALIVGKFMFGYGVPGWLSIMAIVLLSSGLTIFFNGIIAIYIATIFLEVKRRPRSIVRDIIRS